MKKTITLLLIIVIKSTLHSQCWKTIDCGNAYVMAVKPNGDLWGWGSSGTNGALGAPVAGYVSPELIENNSNFKKISCGAFHTLAIKNDGTLWATGLNNSGQIGDGTQITRDEFTQIGIDTDWKEIVAGTNTSMGIKENGTLWAWGWNEYGQLGTGDLINKNTPIQIGNEIWQAISANYQASIAIKYDGTLWAWGRNNYGQLGNGIASSNITKTPTQIGTDNNWINITCGGWQSLAIKSDGTLWAWGYNSSGQLGDGSNIDKYVPTQIGTENNWKNISTSGGSFTLATKTDGTLWTWGRNDLGQLGDGTIVNRNTPGQIFLNVAIDSTWMKVYTGIGFSLGVNESGVFVWGSNAGFALGYPNSIDHLTIPTDIVTMDNSLQCSLNVNEFNSTFDLFPNPAEDYITIKNRTNISLDKIVILDISGKIVYNSNNDSEQIYVGNLKKGIYVVKLEFESKQYIVKLIKK